MLFRTSTTFALSEAPLLDVVLVFIIGLICRFLSLLSHIVSVVRLLTRVPIKALVDRCHLAPTRLNAVSSCCFQRGLFFNIAASPNGAPVQSKLFPAHSSPTSPLSLQYYKVCRLSASGISVNSDHPRVCLDVFNVESLLHISVQHSLYQIYAIVAVRILKRR